MADIANNDWKENTASHRKLILEHLRDVFCFAEPSKETTVENTYGKKYSDYWSADNVSRQLVSRLEDRACKSGLHEVVPQGWTQKQSERHAEVAFLIARMAKKMNIDGFDKAVGAYAEATAQGIRPDFTDKIDRFEAQVFKTTDGRDVTGAVLMNEVRKELALIRNSPGLNK